MTPTWSAALALDARAEAGESPWWCAAEDCLYWVDIHGRRLHRFDPRTGADRAWTTPDLVTFVAPHEAGGLIVALRDRVCHVDLASERYITVAKPPLPPGGRLNDATVDARGRLVIGAMTAPDDKDARAALYRIDLDGTCAVLFDGFRTVNGLAFSPDGKTLYASDSHPAVRTVFACTYDVASGTAGARRAFVVTHDLPGRPDGGCVDADGAYWMAAVDGGCLLRFDADARVTGTVLVPVEKPSKAAFGGAALDTLFITSLRRNLRTPLAQQPLAGGLFTARPGVRGIALRDCAISLS
ncbi:MAG TPA: SMP-30/gluconolactonase/LRE family protein [Casimicrobiaceae bacterium]|nr:SMP-30/gluconolactonase/LRE family protein [Casimicrobiaceae bacterium]